MSKIYRAGLKIDSNAEEVAQEFDDLSKATDKAADSAQRLDAKFEDIYGELQPLTTRMGEAEDRLYELALAGDTASQEYQDLLDKVGEYRKVQIQTDLAVDAAATTMTQKLGMGINAATSSFAGLQGVMGLVGVESEALEKTLLKVQSALAIQQSVQGLRESAPLFKKMGMAAKSAFANMTRGAKLFAATGLGLVITGIATAIALLDDVEEKEEDLEEQRKQHEEEQKARHQAYLARQQAKIDAIQEESDKEIAELDRQRRKALSEGKSVAEFEKAILEEKAQQIQNTANAYVEESAAIKERYEEYREELKWRTANIPYEEAAEQKRSRAYVASMKKEMDAMIARNNQIKKLVDEEKEKYKEVQTDMEVFDNEIRAEKIAKWKTYRDQRLSIARQIEDGQIAIMEEGVEKEVKQSNVRFDRLIEDVKRNEKITAKEKEKLINLYLVQQFENEDKIRDKYRKEQLQKEINAAKELQEALDKIMQERLNKEKADKEILAGITKEYFDREATERLGAYAVEVAQTNAKYDALVKLAEKYGQTTFHIEKQRQAELAALDKENNEKTKEEKQELNDAIIAGASATFQTLGNLAQLFAGESEESQRKAFKVQKAANIAQATIDTYASAVAAYKSLAGVPVVGPVLGGAAAAAAVTAGLLNIKAIAQQEFESNATTDTGGNFSAGVEQAPEFNVVGDAGINQLAQIQQQPVQAYVVSGEVTTSQALDRNRVENATL